ncbi:mannanase [Cyathus striatus]|nr:mannanase [Cyathus striatus]
MTILFFIIALQLWLAAGLGIIGRNNASGFVKIQHGQFQLDNSLFRFYGTNAYWLHMATDDDIDTTFHDIATAGFQVVRTWAFNDVSSKPSSGAYFQILDVNNITINDGPDGLQRLDKVVAAANKYGVKLLFTLTNNWNPVRSTPSSSWNRRQNSAGLPRGYLSNDYGGIDLYVRTFSPDGTHDKFYSDRTIVDAFKNYLAHVVPRYASSSAVLGWEIGNDLRCSSTLPASSACNTRTITNWTAEISSYIKTLDCNHLVTAGDGGFYCLGCKKLFATQSTQPTTSLPGPSFDGTYGVDTEDIMAIPSIDFGSLQLFPDQTEYFPAVSNSSATNSIAGGSTWVALHSNSAALIGKPEVLTAAAIVTQDHYSSFVPFNSSTPLPEGSCGGAQAFQQDYAFTTWAGIVLSGNIQGMLEYLWLQDGLTSHGTTFSRRGIKRDLSISPQDGNGHYVGVANNQNADQFRASLPSVSQLF